MEKQIVPNSCAVIVSAYNDAEYVGRTLKNLSEIAGKGYRTVIVDDASTDGTKRIIQEYTKKHPEIQALYMEQNGRKIGAQQAALDSLPSGVETIILLDSDSFIKNPEALPSAVKSLYKDNNLAGGVFSLQPEGSGVMKHIQDAEYALAEGMRRWTSKVGKIRCAAGAGAIYKRRVLETALGTHSGEFLGDDFELTTIVQDKGHKMVLFPEVKVGTYVPETWLSRIQQLDKWIRGGWRVWGNKPKELGRQLSKPDRFALTLGMELTYPITLAATVYGTAEAAKRFDFNSAYLASTAGWTALNTTIAAYGKAKPKILAKTALVSQLWLPIALTTYLPATILAAGRTLKNKIKKLAKSS